MLNNVQTSYTSSEQVQVYRFSPVVSVAVPLLAIVLQAYVPLYLHFLSILDLPLLVVIFFAVARRGKISGLLTGALIGILQDSLTHAPIGLYGMANTVIGYLASSIGAKLDVENPGSRFLLTGAFYVLHQAIFYIIARGLANQVLQLVWQRLLIIAALNALVAVPVFSLLDRFKQRA